MSATVIELVGVNLRQNVMSNDSELVFQEDSNLVTGILGIICTPVIVALLTVVVCVFTAYKTTFQRLILYQIVIALICECSFALQIQINFSHPRWLCVTAIYLYLYSTLAWYVYTTAVTNYLLLLTLRLFRANSNIWQHGKFAECVCVCLSLASPMAYVWIPICDGTYEALNCDKLSSARWYKDAIILNIAVLVLCLEVLTVALTLCSLFCYLHRMYRAQKHLTTLLKHFIYHTCISGTVVGFALLMSMYCLYRYYYRSGHPSKILSGTVYTIGAVIEPLALFLSVVFQTLLSIRHQNGQHRKTFCEICCKSRCKVPREQPYTGTDRNENQTNPSSHPFDQPSHTYFSVPYTGAFTHVASDEHYQSTGEQTPLLISGSR